MSPFKKSSAVHTSNEIPFNVSPLAELFAGKNLLPDLKLSGRLSTSKSAYNSFFLVWIRFSVTQLCKEDERHDLPRIFLNGNLLNPSQHLNPELYKVQVEELLTDKDFANFAENHILQTLPKMSARYKSGKPLHFAGHQAVEWAPTGKTADATEDTAEQSSRDCARTIQASSSVSDRPSILSLKGRSRWVTRIRRNLRQANSFLKRENPALWTTWTPGQDAAVDVGNGSYMTSIQTSLSGAETDENSRMWSKIQHDDTSSRSLSVKKSLSSSQT
jgi:hypothetical protein